MHWSGKKRKISKRFQYYMKWRIRWFHFIMEIIDNNIIDLYKKFLKTKNSLFHFSIWLSLFKMDANNSKMFKWLYSVSLDYFVSYFIFRSFFQDSLGCFHFVENKQLKFNWRKCLVLCLLVFLALRSFVTRKSKGTQKKAQRFNDWSSHSSTQLKSTCYDSSRHRIKVKSTSEDKLSLIENLLQAKQWIHFNQMRNKSLLFF